MTGQGWPRVEEARGCVLRAALRCLSAQLAEEHGDAAAEAEYANEQLALAARSLTEATAALPADELPAGWVPAPDVDPFRVTPGGSR